MTWKYLLCAVVALGLHAGEPNLGVVGQRLSTGLSRPVGITHAPGDTARLFVIEQHAGTIRIIDLPGGALRSTPFLTISGLTTGSEEGLLGLAFHPQFASNGFLYVNVTVPFGGGTRTEIRRYTRSASNAQIADPATMQLVISYSQPQSNHNGGWLGFGSDGMLYIASGDGGGSNDEGGGHNSAIGNAQDRNSLLGKLLRIDVDGGSPYAIPASNPYVGISGRREELWAIGLRNPWRCDVDPTTGDIYIGDVGQGAYEEIDVAPAGQAEMNFGWRPYEGNNRRVTTESPVSTYTGPLIDYGRGSGSCIIGGCIYRGSAMPGLSGTYFYADYNSGRFWSLRWTAAGGVTNQAERTSELRNGQSFDNPTSFGRDGAGELYFTDLGDGEIWKIVSSLALSGGPTLAATTVGRPTSRSLTASGGRATISWSVSSGSLPAGMTLDTASGVISGSPSAAGNASFTLRATDGHSATVDRACTLLVNAAPAVTTSALGDATLGVAYTASLASSGGTAPSTWTIDTGSLPSGLSLASNGSISGSPTAGGTASFTVRVTDAVGASATRALTITVVGGLAVTSSATIAPATVGAAITRTATASGGSTPYAWTISAGALPTGTTLSNAGVISGTPSAAGTASFTLLVTDNASATASRACTWVINPALAISTSSLGNGTVGAAYSASLTATGGTAPLSWALDGGSSLPSGLSLAAGGALSGTPSAVGTTSFTVRVTDAVGATTTRGLSITVTSAPAITTSPGLDAWVGEVWTYDVDAAGSPAPTFSLVTAPSGMAIVGSTGVITWTPGAAGTSAVTVRASNGTAPNADQSFTLTARAAGISARLPTAAYLGMPTSDAGPFPSLLSATGVLADTPALQPIAALIPLAPNAPFWSDRAAKRRWVAVPNDGAPYAAGERVTWSASGSWTWPAGTVFVKHFDLPLSEVSSTPTRRLETRLLVITAGGAYGVTYRWNSGGTEATAVTAAQSEDITITTASGTRTQQWYYPSPADCMACHTSAAGFVLGAHTRQLNGVMAYPNGVSENQLTAWNRAGLFNGTPAAPGTLAALSAVGSGASLEQRARSYLDANCAPCHQPGGAPANFDARYDTPLVSQNLIGGSVANDLGVSGARVVVAGDADSSVLWLRLHSTNPAIRMPTVGRLEIDAAGSQLIRDWIEGLAPAGGSSGGSGISVSSGGGGSAGCGAGAALGLLVLLGLLGRWRLRS